MVGRQLAERAGNGPERMAEESRHETDRPADGATSVAGTSTASAAATSVAGTNATSAAATGAVTVATVLANLLAYLVPMLGARQLSAADLSSLATVLALVGIATVPGLGLQIAIAAHRARHGPAPTRRVALTTAALTGLIVAAATPVLAVVLRLPAGLLALLTLMTVTVVLSCRWLGEIQGDQRFLRLAGAMTVLGLGRYAGVAAGLAAGLGLTGSLAAGTLTGILALPVLARIAAPDRIAPARPGGSAAFIGSVAHTGSAAHPGPMTLDGRRVLAASSATLAMLVLSYTDLILARQLLSAAESGAYAVGAVLTKGAIWAPQVVTVLALPRLARGDRRTRSVSVTVVAACGAALVIASAAAGGLAFRLAGGPDYTHLGRYAPYFAAVGALYAVLFLLVNARIATGARRPATPLWVASAALAVAATVIAPPTLGGVLACALGTAAATTIALAWLTRHRSAAGGADKGESEPDRPQCPTRV